MQFDQREYFFRDGMQVNLHVMMYDRVNKCSAKYFTDHGWTNLVQETVQIHFLWEICRPIVSNISRMHGWWFFIFISRNDLDKWKLKREIIMEKRMDCMIPVNINIVYNPPGRGGGGFLTKFYTGRLRPEVQPLTLSYAILAEKVPLLYTFYWKKVPLSHTYFRKSCSSSCGA